MRVYFLIFSVYTIHRVAEFWGEKEIRKRCRSNLLEVKDHYHSLLRVTASGKLVSKGRAADRRVLLNFPAGRTL